MSVQISFYHASNTYGTFMLSIIHNNPSKYPFVNEAETSQEIL
jgi:hypothetical protein